MEFGNIQHTELDSINFRLPPDPANNQTVLRGTGEAHPRVFLGLPRWGRKEWVGTLYPLRSKESEYLQYYSAHFNMVELNATHYKLIGGNRISVWEDMVKTKDFKFCPKMLKDITHAGPLYAKDLVLEKFLDQMKYFGEALGPIIIQLSESHSPKRKNDLYQFLEMLPTEFSFFLEVRHKDWFTPEIMMDLTGKLREHNIGFIITDTAGARYCAHMHLTVPKAFIRFVTNNLHSSDFDRTDQWAERIHQWLQKGIEEIYFVVHMRDEEYSLDLVEYIVQKFNEVCKLNLPPLQLIK